MNALRPDSVLRLQASWKALVPFADDLVRRFYERLFSETPKLRQMFPDKMREMHKKLIDMLSKIVDALDDPSGLRRVLGDLGARHRSLGVEVHHYDLVKHALISTLAEVAGDSWSAELERDWSVALSSVAQHMVRGHRAKHDH